MDLWDHPLLAGCDLDALAPTLLRLKPQRVARGQQLVMQRRGPARLFLVLEGSLLAFGRTAEGRRVVFELARAGDLDGILAAAGRRGHYTVAASDGVVVGISRPDLQRLMTADPRVAVNLSEILMTRLVKREQQLEAVAHTDTVRRLARHLLSLAGHVGEPDAAGEVRMRRFTHQVLADMVGVRRETVTRALNILSSGGGVVARGHQLTLRPARLQELLKEGGGV